MFPFIDDLAFPKSALPDALLERTLNPDRIRAIRHDLQIRGNAFIRSRSSTHIHGIVLDEPADIILSESVLEHVDDLKSTYEAFRRWLAPSGTMVHLIDFSSHNLSRTWNGHWQCSPVIWSIVRGKRYYLINRMPLQTHLNLIQANGLRVVHSELLRRLDGLTPDRFSIEFRDMGLRDATTALAAMVCRRIDRDELSTLSEQSEKSPY